MHAIFGVIIGVAATGSPGGSEATPTSRAAWAARLRVESGGDEYRAEVDRALDEIAAALEVHLDIDGLIALSRLAAVRRG